MEYQEGNARIPFYLTYPMENLYLMEMEYEKDMDRVKSLYPAEVREILPYIERRCDELEYEGSRIYDENPDREMMDQEIRQIYKQICQDRGMSDGSEIAGSAEEPYVSETVEEMDASEIEESTSSERMKQKMDAAGPGGRASAAGMEKKMDSAGPGGRASAAGTEKRMDAAGPAGKASAAGMEKKMDCADPGGRASAAGMEKKMDSADPGGRASAAGMEKKMDSAGPGGRASAAGMEKELDSAGPGGRASAMGMEKKMDSAGPGGRASAMGMEKRIHTVGTEEDMGTAGFAEQKDIIRSEAEGPFTAMSGNGSREGLLSGRRQFTFRVPEWLAGSMDARAENGFGTMNASSGMQGQLKQMSVSGDRVLRPGEVQRPPRPGEKPRPPRPGEKPRPPRPGEGQRPPRPGEGPRPPYPGEGPRPPRPGEGPRPPYPGEGPRPPRPECGSWLCSMVGILFADEMYRRRCRHRRCERWW